MSTIPPVYALGVAQHSSCSLTIPYAVLMSPTLSDLMTNFDSNPSTTQISPSHANPPVSGTESDSDSFLSPDHSPLAGGHFGTGIHTHNIAHQYNHGHNHTLSMGLSASTSNKPLSSIAERRHGSGDEEEESDEDDDGDGDDWTPEQRGNYQREKKKQADECVIRTGYLWKKGERRKVRRISSLPVFLSHSQL